MKTKPITLILTLLFCLSGTAFAEKKKENIKGYKVYEDLVSLKKKHFKSYGGIVELTNLIAKKEGENAPYGDANTLLSISRIVSSLTEAIRSLYIILSYEELFIRLKINNDYLKNYHNSSRGSEMDSFKSSLDRTIEFIKKFQIDLKNTTAVIAVNDYLKILSEIEVWYNQNKDFKIK